MKNFESWGTPDKRLNAPLVSSNYKESFSSEQRNIQSRGDKKPNDTTEKKSHQPKTFQSGFPQNQDLLQTHHERDSGANSSFVQREFQDRRIQRVFEGRLNTSLERAEKKTRNDDHLQQDSTELVTQADNPVEKEEYDSKSPINTKSKVDPMNLMLQLKKEPLDMCSKVQIDQVRIKSEKKKAAASVEDSPSQMQTNLFERTRRNDFTSGEHELYPTQLFHKEPSFGAPVPQRADIEPASKVPQGQQQYQNNRRDEAWRRKGIEEQSREKRIQSSQGLRQEQARYESGMAGRHEMQDSPKPVYNSIRGQDISYGYTQNKSQTAVDQHSRSSSGSPNRLVMHMGDCEEQVKSRDKIKWSSMNEYNGERVSGIIVEPTDRDPCVLLGVTRDEYIDFTQEMALDPSIQKAGCSVSVGNRVWEGVLEEPIKDPRYHEAPGYYKNRYRRTSKSPTSLNRSLDRSNRYQQTQSSTYQEPSPRGYERHIENNELKNERSEAEKEFYESREQYGRRVREQKVQGRHESSDRISMEPPRELEELGRDGYHNQPIMESEVDPRQNLMERWKDFPAKGTKLQEYASSSKKDPTPNKYLSETMHIEDDEALELRDKVPLPSNQPQPHQRQPMNSQLNPDEFITPRNPIHQTMKSRASGSTQAQQGGANDTSSKSSTLKKTTFGHPIATEKSPIQDRSLRTPPKSNFLGVSNRLNRSLELLEPGSDPNLKSEDTSYQSSKYHQNCYRSVDRSQAKQRTPEKIVVPAKTDKMSHDGVTINSNRTFNKRQLGTHYSPYFDVRQIIRSTANSRASYSNVQVVKAPTPLPFAAGYREDSPIKKKPVNTFPYYVGPKTSGDVQPRDVKISFSMPVQPDPSFRPHTCMTSHHPASSGKKSAQTYTSGK